MSSTRELARAALAEITPDDTVGEYLGTQSEGEHLESHLWASAKPGYPDWRWTVTVVSLPDAEPSVMELELLPTEDSVIAPDWVPWSVRLAEFKAAQAAAAAAGQPTADEDLLPEFEGDDELDDDEDDELDELDDDVDDDDDDEDDDNLDDSADDDLDEDGVAESSSDEEFSEEEDLDEFGAADDDDIRGITLPGEDDLDGVASA